MIENSKFEREQARILFAAHALSGILACTRDYEYVDRAEKASKKRAAAKLAFLYADEMMIILKESSNS